MPPGWKPHIERHLLNALPEGARLEALASLVSDGAEKTCHPVDLIPRIDELPGRFSVGSRSAELKRYVPMPENVPAVTSRLSAAWLHPRSSVRVNAKPSFSGYQDKFIAKLAVENGEATLSVPSSNERGNVIVKPGNPELPYVAENEFACMETAKLLGFKVPRVFLFRQPDAASEIERKRKHFLIERFDYAPDKDGNYQKLTVAETASLMGLSSETKYGTTTEELFRTARNSLDSDGLKTFARMYFLGILVCNGDMHAKNFSFVLDPEDRSYTPSPLYDCLCTSIYGFNDTLALPLGNSCRPKLSEIIAFMKSLVSPGEMRELAESVPAALDAVLPLAFDAETHSARTAQKRLRNAIIGRSRSMARALKDFQSPPNLLPSQPLERR
jgi:hypothetical protein